MPRARSAATVQLTKTLYGLLDLDQCGAGLHAQIVEYFGKWRNMPRTSRRFVRRLFRTGTGWTLGEIILIAVTLGAILAACAIIVYEVEVNLPERQSVVKPASTTWLNG